MQRKKLKKPLGVGDYIVFDKTSVSDRIDFKLIFGIVVIVVGIGLYLYQLDKSLKGVGQGNGIFDTRITPTSTNISPGQQDYNWQENLNK